MNRTDLARLLDPMDVEPVAFARLAFERGAIIAPEVREWVWHVVGLLTEEEVTRLPPFFFDYADFKSEDRTDFFRVSQPYGGAAHSKEEKQAMEAIAWRRGVNTAWTLFDRATAERAEARNPQIEKRFREFFPFIEW